MTLRGQFCQRGVFCRYMLGLRSRNDNISREMIEKSREMIDNFLEPRMKVEKNRLNCAKIGKKTRSGGDWDET